MPLPLTQHNRPQQLLDAIDAANAGLKEGDRRSKYRKLAASPYAFFRGTNHLYWADVWHDWRFSLYGGLPDTQTWLQGDAHAFNFGAYGHHDDWVRYGMDDFDDALVGDYQYDLWRLAISLVLDAQENAQLSSKSMRKALGHLVESYYDELSRHRHGEVPQWVDVGRAKGPLKPFMEKVERTSGRAKMLAKWTRMSEQGRRLHRPGKLARLPAQAERALRQAIETDYLSSLRGELALTGARHFEVKDTARRLDAGTGSLGLARFYVLIEGGDARQHDDVILDVKEQRAPAGFAMMNAAQQRAWGKAFAHEAARHAAAFAAIAEHPDIYLVPNQMSLDVFCKDFNA